MFRPCLYVYIDSIYRLVNRREKGRRQKWLNCSRQNGSQRLAEVRFKHYSVIKWIRHHIVFCGPRPDNPWSIFTICCSFVVYHNFVSFTISRSKVSCKLLWSTVKSAAMSSLFEFSWLLIASWLVKEHKLRASLKSGILSAYSIGLINELK